MNIFIFLSMIMAGLIEPQEFTDDRGLKIQVLSNNRIAIGLMNQVPEIWSYNP